MDIIALAGLEAHGCLGDTSSTVSIVNSIFLHLRLVGSHLHCFLFKYFSISCLSRTTVFDPNRNSKLNAELQHSWDRTQRCSKISRVMIPKKLNRHLLSSFICKFLKKGS